MKVICDRGALAEAIQGVTSVVAQRSPSPVLHCVHLTAKGGVLMLAATDLEVGLRVAVEEVDVEQEGEALVIADKLSQIVRSSPDPTLTIETSDHKAKVKGADAVYTIYGYDPGEAPTVREAPDGPVDFEIPAGTLMTVIQRTLFAAAAEQSRYAINGVLFDRDAHKLRLVATDGRRLAVATGQCTKGEGAGNCIVPAKALSLLTKLARIPETNVRVTMEDSQIVFVLGDGPAATVLSSNLVEGAFPPFEDVIPKDQDKKVTSNTEALSNAIRRAALLTNQESKGVRLAFADNRLTLTSRAPEMGEAQVEVELKYEGDPMEIGFNPGFITDALRVLDESDVTIELKASDKPGVLKIGNDFTYVVMPVNLS